jgi:parallel beta-helix repeat protein
VFLQAGAPALAATRQVPADFPTIQGALRESAEGDTVVVAPGRYQELILMTPGAVLRSSHGPDSTVLAGADLEETLLDERVIEVRGGDRTTVIEGFTIEPTILAGAGIWVENGSPTIRDNVIRNMGWGIHLRMSEDAWIEGNVIRGCSGFAILAFASSPTIVRNEIADNRSIGISVAGKESKPVIGGSRENANRIYANPTSILIDSRNEIDATWNDWGWEVTSEMETNEYPADISTIMDGNDKAKSRKGRGKVDYRNWIRPQEDAPAEKRSLWWIAGVVAVLLVGVFVAISRRG